MLVAAAIMHRAPAVQTVVAATLPAALHTASTVYAIRVLLARNDRNKARRYSHRQLALVAAAVAAQVAIGVLFF